MGRLPAQVIVQPVLAELVRSYPDIKLEIDLNDRFTDIVAERFDAGIRLGEEVEKDMIAVRIGPEVRAAVVAAPSYLAQHTAPRTPRDLARHQCINYRLGSSGGLYAWQLRSRPPA